MAIRREELLASNALFRAARDTGLALGSCRWVLFGLSEVPPVGSTDAPAASLPAAPPPVQSQTLQPRRLVDWQILRRLEPLSSRCAQRTQARRLLLHLQRRKTMVSSSRERAEP